MDMKDITVSPLTYELLFENGKLDCENGVSMYNGWNEICVETGYSRERTPAREAYEDGYYSTRPKQAQA